MPLSNWVLKDHPACQDCTPVEANLPLECGHSFFKRRYWGYSREYVRLKQG